jgi:hypothetical protein
MLFQRTCVVVFCLLIAGTGTVPAQDTGKGTPGCREINLKGLKLDPPAAKSSWMTPTKITSAVELANAFPNKDTQDKIAKQVDFMKDYLLYFRWQGSGGDKLSFLPFREGSEILFTYKAGLTDDIKHHTKLYALDKTIKWMTKSP